MKELSSTNFKACMQCMGCMQDSSRQHSKIDITTALSASTMLLYAPHEVGMMFISLSSMYPSVNGCKWVSGAGSALRHASSVQI